MMRQMAPAASGVLIDAYYGAWPAIATEAMPPDKGMLVRVEKSGSPKNKVGGPMGEIEPGWCVEKIKLMGADAVKLLAPFEPGEPISAEHQFALIQHVYEECKKYDILFLLEPVAFPYNGEKKTDKAYLDRKAETVIESARQISRFCDVYKAEFPGTLGHDSDDQLHDNLHALERGERAALGPALGGRRLPRLLQAGQAWRWSAAARASWAAGPSGRSTSSRTAPRPGPSSPRPTGLKRVADVDAVVRENGTPWFAKYGLTKEDLTTVRAAEGWHFRYAPGASAAGGAGGHVVRAGEVY